MKRSWLAGGLAVVVLAGVGIGLLISGSDGGRRAATPSPPPQLGTVGSPCLTVSANAGHPLTVGVKLVNDGARPVVLDTVRAVFPKGGLRQLDSRIAHCDTHASDPVHGHQIEPAGTARVSLNLAVLVRCPAPLPVQLRLNYTVDGAPVTQTLTPFPDLGDISYPDCR